MNKLLASLFALALALASFPALSQNLWSGLSSGSAPVSSFGREADWYLDASTGKLYGPKAYGAWGSSSSNLTTWLAALSGSVAPTGTWTFPNPLSVSAAVPTISSCGTNPPVATAGSSNSAGQFTLGTGTPTACTVTFATAFSTAAFCTVSPASSGGAAISGGYYISAQSKSA